MSNIVDRIRAGYTVRIRTEHGSEVEGRAVMLGPAGWVINTGGPHGTPAIADETNIVAVPKLRYKHEPQS